MTTCRLILLSKVMMQHKPLWVLVLTKSMQEPIPSTDRMKGEFTTTHVFWVLLGIA